MLTVTYQEPALTTNLFLRNAFKVAYRAFVLLASQVVQLVIEATFVNFDSSFAVIEVTSA